MLTKSILALATIVFLMGTTLGPALSDELPMRAVVNGHPVQPTESQLLALGHPDLTKSQAKEVTSLYHQLMQNNNGNEQRAG